MPNYRKGMPANPLDLSAASRFVFRKCGRQARPAQIQPMPVFACLRGGSRSATEGADSVVLLDSSPDRQKAGDGPLGPPRSSTPGSHYNFVGFRVGLVSSLPC